MAELQVSGLIHVFQKDPPLLDLLPPRVLRPPLLLVLRPPRCFFRLIRPFFVSPFFVLPFFFLLLFFPVFFLCFPELRGFGLDFEGPLAVPAAGAPATAATTAGGGGGGAGGGGGGGGRGGRGGGVLVKAGGRVGPEA